ncbi:MAG: hypothetical protein AMXMBFR12_05300 [Candidatus Babeliales bacterium]
MVSKQNSFLFSLVLLFHLVQATIDPKMYQKDAQEWINQFISKDTKLFISESDLQIIANLLYFSYLRSLETIQAQNAAKKTFESVWHGWQNIAHTRMNPSIKIPHLRDYEQQAQHYEEFVLAQQKHSSIGQAYSHIAEAAVKQHYLSKVSEDAVIKLREHARTIVAHAFLDAKKIVGNLYHIAIEGLRGSESKEENEILLRFDVIETISYYLPILSMQSFIEAEKAQLKTSEQSWQIINTMLDVNMTIWDTIETARASYYLAHYNEVARLMTNLALEKKYWLIMVDEQGINKQHKEYLPKNIIL